MLVRRPPRSCRPPRTALPCAVLAWGAVCTLALRCQAQTVDVSKLPPPAVRTVDFLTDIRPILERSCLRCHGPVRPKSGFRLDNRDSALTGGHLGQDILPGNSADSRFIHFVARLDPEMAMPPEGKGEPLTPDEVALLRAWIDQGAPWPEEKTEEVRLEFAPAVAFTTVSGNEAKFREHAWMREGWRGGLERFELTKRFSPEARLTLSGHALSDDFRADLLLEQRDLGFLRGGFEQFRRFDADTGGYFPNFSQPGFRLGRDLHLDIGRAWLELGLTLPDWPRVLLGYELQYRNGEKATLQWGPVSESDQTRNIYPALKRTHERTHILKLDLDYERNGWRAENQFRGEWTRLHTRQENVSRLALDVPDSFARDSVRQGWRAFQGANTFRLERSFKDWLHASGGYLYSRLSADADFSLDTFNPSGTPLFPPVIQRIEWRSQRIVLERESHVGNANLLLGPWQATTLALALQAEWTRQNGTMEGMEESVTTPAFPFDLTTPVRGLSDLDRTTLSEGLALRCTRLRYTTLFADARLRQEWLAHHESADGHHIFVRDTDAESQLWEGRLGFDCSPLGWFKFGAHYRIQNRHTSYDDGFADGDPMDITGYPTLIRSRDLDTQEVESRVTLRPLAWLRLTLKHRMIATDYHTATEPISILAPGDLSPGGRLFAGNSDAHVFSFNATLTPWRRLHWFNTLTYQDARTAARHDFSDAVVAYRGEAWSVLSQGRFVLTSKTDLTGGYSFSRADFRQRNFASGLPVGPDYTLHGAQAGVVSRCSPKLTTKLQYGFWHYAEPSLGGANDYTAHAVFVSLHWQLP